MKQIRLYVTQAFAFIGALIILSGVALFSSQVLQFINHGVWIKVPTTTLFIDLQEEESARLLDDFSQISSDIATGVTHAQQTVHYRKVIAYSNIYSRIPDWFKKNDTWLINPERLYGLQQIIKWCLDTLPLSCFLILIGSLLFFLSISHLPAGNESTQKHE